MFDKIHEECGVFGAYSLKHEDVSTLIYYGLFALQHRGQESCGIAVTDTKMSQNIQVYKNMGLVNDVFNKENLAKLNGNLGVGHVRYSTSGNSTVTNAQPLVINYWKGTLAIAHNGNIVNQKALKDELSQTGAIFQTTSDSEIIPYLIARARLESKSVEEAVVKAMPKIVGAYSLAIASPQKLIAARDPNGFHPLCIGQKEDTYFVSSESCALDAVGAKFIRDVEPGEVVIITEEGIKSVYKYEAKKSTCIFEYIYFARPDSAIDGISVYEARLNAGRMLHKRYPVDADVVVGVPDSGTPAAYGYAQEANIPFSIAFIKNNYVGRTFIKPSQDQRSQGVSIKLNILKDEVKDKKIVLVDDSIVRGTTMKNIVKQLKELGAKEVHVRISSPPFLHPCFYGTDVPTNKELIAFKYTQDEIRDYIGCDTLGYLKVEDLNELVDGRCDYCNACFTGNYPTEVEDGQI